MAQAPQFGPPDAGRDYPDRPAAFGIAERDGKIALVRIEKPDAAPWFDLPGGALDPGEDPAQAVVREFAEETGLLVTAGEAFARADQCFINTEHKAYNNRGVFMVVRVTGEAPERKVEDDHELVWMAPQAALTALRHDAHAWAVAAWLRRIASRSANG
jgi:8-oxo-dGTP diphosphatase